MIDFASSPQSTLGVEWEIALIDRESGELTQRAAEVLGILRERRPELLEPASDRAHVTGEFLENTIEVITGVCTTVAQACRQLQELTDTIREITDGLGIEFYPAGTHPFSRWSEQPVVAKERYRRVVERAQYWGRHMVIYGVHVHVGVDSRDKVLPLVDALTNYGPHLLALSCSSPYWEGIDTGSLVATDVINDPSEDRWDVRPVPRYGTIEMRYCDGLASLPDVAAVVAFTQCLVEYFSRRIEAGDKPEVLAPWHAQENKWRVARYGLDAKIVVSNAPEQRTLREDFELLLPELEPVARDLDCKVELAQVRRILAEGTGADRQRAVFERTGSMREVALDVAAQSRARALR